MGSERKRNATASRSEVERFGAVAFLFIGCNTSRGDDREGGSRRVEGQRVRGRRGSRVYLFIGQSVRQEGEERSWKIMESYIEFL